MWLTCSMRVATTGNLTVELIRAERFDMACQAHQVEHDTRCQQSDQQTRCAHTPIDRVELSPEALASDPWATDTKRTSAVVPAVGDPHEEEGLPGPPNEAERLSPVVGSAALAGLGVALVVPGSLLDVVA